MVIEDEYAYDEEEDYDDTGGEADPKWRTLSPKERKELMKNEVCLLKFRKKKELKERFIRVFYRNEKMRLI